MNPQLKSIITSMALTASTSMAAWAASKGLIPSADQSAVASVIANDVVTFGFSALSAALIWYKTRSHTPTAQIAAVNAADNGVKVVPKSGPGVQIDAPLK